MALRTIRVEGDPVLTKSKQTGRQDDTKEP